MSTAKDLALQLHKANAEIKRLETVVTASEEQKQTLEDQESDLWKRYIRHQEIWQEQVAAWSSSEKLLKEQIQNLENHSTVLAKDLHKSQKLLKAEQLKNKQLEAKVVKLEVECIKYQRQIELLDDSCRVAWTECSDKTDKIISLQVQLTESTDHIQQLSDELEDLQCSDRLSLAATELAVVEQRFVLRHSSDHPSMLPIPLSPNSTIDSVNQVRCNVGVGESFNSDDDVLDVQYITLWDVSVPDTLPVVEVPVDFLGVDDLVDVPLIDLLEVGLPDNLPVIECPKVLGLV